MSTKPLKQEKLSTFYSDALDWQIFRASQLPAPGVCVPPPPTHAFPTHPERTHTSARYYSDKLVLPEGGTFSKFTAASYVDASIKKVRGGGVAVRVFVRTSAALAARRETAHLHLQPHQLLPLPLSPPGQVHAWTRGLPPPCPPQALRRQVSHEQSHTHPKI